MSQEALSSAQKETVFSIDVRLVRAGPIKPIDRKHIAFAGIGLGNVFCGCAEFF